MYENTSTGMF